MEKTQEEGPRAFSVVLQAIADGEAHQEAGQKLHDLLQTLREHAELNNSSASGKLTLELKVKVDARGAASVGYDVAIVKPATKRVPATMWLTKGGNLTPENPRQMSLGLRTVEGGKDEVRAIETAQEVRNV